MFCDKLYMLFTLLNVRPAEFARAARCDKSYISRLTSGKRVPKRGGSGAARLINGIYLCADEKGSVDGLCGLIQCDGKSSPDMIKERLSAWLFDDNEPHTKSTTSKEKAPHRASGDRLSAVMELTGLSNIRMGRSLNIDPSYISRFRSGFRSPRSNPKLMNDICSLLLSRIEDQGKTAELADLIGSPADDVSDHDKAAELLFIWLYGNDDKDSSPFVEGLLDQIGAFSADVKKPPLSFEEAVDESILSDSSPVYYGKDGLCRAVLRFLGNVIKRGHKELFLYSDQNMSWMVSDPVFHARWSALMIMCVSRGVRINIIHNIKRDLSEMADAIRSWMPLYPSGMISSYYCRDRVGERFSATVFLCPGYACISGFNVSGAEDERGIYRFDTDITLLEAYGASYRDLLERSGKLARVYAAEQTGASGDGDARSLYMFNNTLSLASMPEKTLVSALDRVGADDVTRRRMLGVRSRQEELLTRHINDGFLYEFAPLPDESALFNGEVYMDLPGLGVPYTPAEFSIHLRNITELSEGYANYRFTVIPEDPFEDVKVIISEQAVAVTRLKAPYLTIMFEHPELCRAFVAYAERIREQHKQDRFTTGKMIERYL